MNQNIKIWIWFFALFVSRGVFGQDQEKRLNLVLLIDNDIPTPDVISKAFFLIQDSAGNVRDTLPFLYGVGGLVLTEENYNKLFRFSPGSQIYINFHYYQWNKHEGSQDFNYKQKLSARCINEWYTILKIHNYSLRESRKEYTSNGDGFAVQISYPGGGIVSGVLPKQQ
jgi:hypothetical protein